MSRHWFDRGEQRAKSVAQAIVVMLLALGPVNALAGPAEDASALIDSWAAAFNSNDVDALVKLYAPDAIFLSSVNPSINEGTAAIREYYAPVRGSGRKVEIGERRMTVLTDAVVVGTGLYEFTGMRDGKPVANPARFTMVIVKRGDNWVIANHHSSQRPKPLQ
jgi:uncharacterized protein (TIGR02246 family)